MARVHRLRGVEACAVLLGAIVQVFGVGRVRTAKADTTAGATESSGCPDPDAVWSTVIKLVPSEAAQLIAAKPRVEIVDLGERYRVRVATDRGMLERTYADPARDCEKRVRFAAEFIVVSLLPPQLGIAPDATSTPSTRAGGAPAAPTSSSPGASPPTEAVPPPPATAAAPAPPTRPVGPPPVAARRVRSSFLRIELSAVSEVAPPLGAPGVLTWGAGLRARVGPGALAGIVGIAYLPKANFGVNDFTGNVTRVPAIGGLRVQIVKKSWQLDGDAALSAEFERYEGVSPHTPSAATRWTPGLELGVVASPRPWFGFAPIASVHCAWFPFTQELATAPQGNLGSTPSFWIGLELGMSLEL